MSTASDYKPNFDLTGSVMLITGPARGCVSPAHPHILETTARLRMRRTAHFMH